MGEESKFLEFKYVDLFFFLLQRFLGMASPGPNVQAIKKIFLDLQQLQWPTERLQYHKNLLKEQLPFFSEAWRLPAEQQERILKSVREQVKQGKSFSGLEESVLQRLFREKGWNAVDSGFRPF